MSPHLVQMVEHATARGVEVGFNTNGPLLDEATARALIGARLGWLHVSLDGATPETYEEVRHGTDFKAHAGQFERVVGNLRALIRLRREAGAGSPRVLLVLVAMRRNIHELEQLVRLGADIGSTRCGCRT